MSRQGENGVVSIEYTNEISLFVVDNCINDAYRINEISVVDNCLNSWDCFYPIENILVIKVSAYIMGAINLSLILFHLLPLYYIILSSPRGMNTKQIGIVISDFLEYRTSAIARKRG